MIMAPIEAPVPMPAFAPVERGEVDAGIEVCEGREVAAGSVGRAVPVFNCIFDEIGVSE